MLSKQYRLQKSSAFTATYRVKNSFYLDGVAVFVGLRKKTQETSTRVGFVVSKKTHKRAVRRNHLKRLMRESYRLLLKDNKVGKSNEYMSLVFVGHDKALGLSCKEMKRVIEELLAKIND